MNEPWNGTAAVACMATVQRAEESKRIPPNHPKVTHLKEAVMDNWRRRDLAGIRAACSATVTAIANLPMGTYDWDAAAVRATLEGKRKPTSNLSLREMPLKA